MASVKYKGLRKIKLTLVELDTELRLYIQLCREIVLVELRIDDVLESKRTSDRGHRRGR